MSSLNFVNTVTHVPAHWANDVDALVYDIFEGAQTKEEARAVLGFDARHFTGGTINNTPIGMDVASHAHFTWILIDELPIDPDHAANKRYVDSLFSQAVGGTFFLETDVEVIGTSVGAAEEGTVFPAGMTFTQFVQAISQQVVPPTYVAPTLVLGSAPGAGAFEIGHVITTLTFNSTFTQNDSGGLATGTPGSYKFYVDGVFTPGAAPQNAPVLTNVSLTATINYYVTADYSQGPIKNDNMGNPNPTGRINAGTVQSNTLSFTVYRSAFWGTPVATPNSSSTVRALPNSMANPGNNSGVDASGSNLVTPPTPSFTITIPSGATRVVFAYPATNRVVASVRYQELSDSEVKGNFTETSVNVEGANAYAAIAYRVYTYVPVEPFSQTVHYKVYI